MTLSESTPIPRRRNQIKLILMIVLAWGPLGVAQSMYFDGWGIPVHRVNQGQLVQGLTLADFQLQPVWSPEDELSRQESLAGSASEGSSWQLILISSEACEEACEAALWQLRQIHTALGRESDRVRRALALTMSSPKVEPLTQHFPKLKITSMPPQTYRDLLPRLADTGDSSRHEVVVVDPNGNVVLSYAPAQIGKAILTDMQRLLKLSKIG
ncbi:MAG: hypothetical protein H6999_07055 [Hahellaceae bacterium]|nr:hypothetical protein [Hahellaceae bacterium]